MVPTRVFKNGNSQAIRIPQELRTDTQDYYITKVGKVFIAYPADDPWAATRMAIGAFAKDFMADREQPSWDEVPSREEL
ncbi:MAG: AbrB/MazE/SpoVT family DNA-binding domain-containing protein [Clostridiales bacterium]|nr:AbrB/MazE/SpoVT family DNA-binding domain-containing protein [Clostridiales bacterium]